MSFSMETKNELAHVVPEKKCCMLAEIAGFIRMCGSIRLAGGGKFRIVTTTENPAAARHYKKLIKDYFGIDAALEVGQGNTLKKGRAYILTIGPEDLSEQILRETGILMVKEGMNYISDGIYDGLIRTKCCRKACLRGIFLASGTITDPEKGYHLEFNCSSQILAGDVKKLINSFVDLHAKVSARKKNYAVYVKEAEQIIDILAIMGAHSQIFAFEDVRITKEIRNKANRINNCDNANIDKALQAAEKQLGWIHKIQNTKGLRFLPDKLYDVAILRLDNPEATLQELADMMDPPMKKSGINNRFRKIEEIAGKL
ncbi:DNA-binding protein WhiA [Ihubacter massiliensis]|uniref:Probable cell division protein WhiA n=1 Tax=Hominibacterium faecale TaxID=2839743 RepID=A0A9J6QKC1_9FIRM|nr:MULTISPECIES: DNA-binding protein WhiA [Eubacteriales Family XIII. Incertae Sedis]MCI7300675.1 DNA-binding protein WhiA [Clostridia bacterium]MDE8734170.1 DNA-binding protein WhiA [Eubacteriales bacterium DFI.9.88]MDY3010744.1 DNA-binding protein WhiA [Clostridiales Family XIII bacterium]MCO7121870.1 DNA-binding protein WhiA [Ihubacter massiliensis]MCU7377585.1 DNA-binding protein WhiA [Hominibacterium faecale]